jgi:selenoprotein W-related protein
LTDEILGERELEYYIRSWHLIPSTGGTFELTINGELLFSKKELKRHAEPGEIRSIIAGKLAQLTSS